MRKARIEIHRVPRFERVFLAVDMDTQGPGQRVDELDARVRVRLHSGRRHGEELGVVRVEPALGGRVVQRLESIGHLPRAGFVGKPDALRLADDRDEGFLAGAGEEELQADAENERDAQERRQRRKQSPRSIFDNSAGDNPVCWPSSTSPIFFFRRSARTLAPMP